MTLYQWEERIPWIVASRTAYAFSQTTFTLGGCYRSDNWLHHVHKNWTAPDHATTPGTGKDGTTQCVNDILGQRGEMFVFNVCLHCGQSDRVRNQDRLVSMVFGVLSLVILVLSCEPVLNAILTETVAAVWKADEAVGHTSLLTD